MTEHKPSDSEVREALDLTLQDAALIKALAAAIGQQWGLGENPEAFFERFIKKAKRYLGFGGAFDANVIPMVYASIAEKRRTTRGNDYRSLKYSYDTAIRKERGEEAERLKPLLEACVIELEELGVDVASLD